MSGTLNKIEEMWKMMEMPQLDMEFTDVIRSSALLVAFVLLVLGERRSWMVADMLVAVGFGAAFLIIPNSLMGFMLVGEQNDLHTALLQTLGVSLMCSAIMSYFTRETRDGTVPITLMMARIFNISIILLAQAATHWGTTRGKKDINYNSQHVYFGMLGTALWALGNLVHLLRSHDFSSYPQHNIRINSHLRVDAWLSMVSAVFFVAFPELALSMVTKTSRDAVHVHLLRVVGTFDLGAAVVALQAPGFLHEHDKKHHLMSRLLTCVALIGLGVFQFFFFQMTTLRQLLISSSFFVPYIANCLLGYFAGGTANYKVKTN